MNNEQTKAHREKYWSECDDQEKIRRLRQEVKLLQAVLVSVLYPKQQDELPMNWTETPNKRTGDEVYF